jgi:hypothetical protein
MQIPDIRSGVPLGSYVAWPRAWIQRIDPEGNTIRYSLASAVWLATAASIRRSAGNRSSG